MRLVGHTILITGGSEGIGLELAKALAPDNTVVICGRSAEKLERAASTLSKVAVEVCDITDPSEQNQLVERVLRKYPSLNVLVNNAGSRYRVDLRGSNEFRSALYSDLFVNFVAPVSLTDKLLKHIQTQPRAAIVNVTTGLVYLPKAGQPFYCAAKAALHSYTRSLRWVLRDSQIQVFEVLMTLVDTNFHQGELPRTLKAMSPAEAARLTLEGILRGREEIHIGKAALARWMALIAPRRGMALVNR